MKQAGKYETEDKKVAGFAHGIEKMFVPLQPATSENDKDKKQADVAPAGRPCFLRVNKELGVSQNYKRKNVRTHSP